MPDPGTVAGDVEALVEDVGARDIHGTIQETTMYAVFLSCHYHQGIEKKNTNNRLIRT